MNEFTLSAKALWQAPLGWLGASLLCGLGLMLLYRQAPLAYRHPLYIARWLVIPYLGLLAGGISPRLMGLTGIHWSASFGFGLVLIGGVLVVLLMVRSITALSLPVNPPPNPLAQQSTYLSVHAATALPISLLQLGAEEFHLAFLRSAIWEILLTFPQSSPQAGYWAAWTALGLALPEALHYHPTFAQRFCKCALLVTTTVLFIFTRNLWLSWLLHSLGWAILAPATVANKG